MGKLVSLKFDITSRKVRGFLGSNVQYVHEERLQIRTLEVNEMFKCHIGDEIKGYILDMLGSYRNDIIQIYE